jgi:hypothetical protein
MSDTLLLPSAHQRGHAVSRVGKRAVSVHAVGHGLASTDRVFISILEQPERSEFYRLRASLLKELEPRGILEKILVEHAAVSHFRLLRAFALDNVVSRNATGRHLGTGELYVQKDDLERLQKLAQYERQIERTFRLSIEKWENMREARQRLLAPTTDAGPTLPADSSSNPPAEAGSD